MDQTDNPRLMANELNAVTLIQASVYNGEDAKIGTIAHVVGQGAALELIVDIGGFLLVGPKLISLMASQLEFRREANGYIHVKTSLSKPDLAALLEHTPPERR